MNIKKTINVLKSNIVLVIALSAALLTSIIVKPDKQYLSYIDIKTLIGLFCVLAVVCAFKDIDFFYILSKKIIKYLSNLRAAVIGLIFITFIGSMLIANDMALLTFLPLGYIILHSTGKQKYMAFTFIMQNISANLGGMLTPFGNPQNLYLYTKYDIPTGEFVKIMFPPFLISISLLFIICVIVLPKDNLKVKEDGTKLDGPRAAIYSLLFALTVLMVFRYIPYCVGFTVILLSLLFLDKNALKMVDYPLLLTFAAFFIFSGNMSRIPAVRTLFEYLLSKNTLIFSIASCQIISNVPSAILLSQFTGNYADLLLGVNIGGTGTLIASLASLITFKEYTKRFPEKTGCYIKIYSVLNAVFLVVLTALMILLR